MQSIHGSSPTRLVRAASAAVAMLLAACAHQPDHRAHGMADDHIGVKEIGSMHVGGRTATLTGLPTKDIKFTPTSPVTRIDPNGEYEVEQMYLQYVKLHDPFRRAAYPLLMMHGGGLAGVTWETKPDGGSSWQMFFLKAGHDVYIADAMERGRASWARYPEIFSSEPIFRTKKEAWELFRIGPKYEVSPPVREAYPGAQFPLDKFDQFMKQGVPRWVTTDDAIVAAYIELVDKVCPCVVLVHSQGGGFGFKVAQARPDKVKALIAVEPSTPGVKDKVAALKDMPIAVIYGDNAKDHPRWGKIRQNVHDFATATKQAGGAVDFIDLPDIGIKGNTHMMMMDRNSDAVAEVIQKWLVSKGFVE